MVNRLLTLAVASLTLAVPGSGAAQVGHLAEGSPYRDMRIRQALFFYGGYLSGGRGNAGVGPSQGPLAGARWEITVGAPSVLYLGAGIANLERPLVNPDDPPDTRFFGTANQKIVMLEGGLHFVLTGRKTWHRLAPFVGLGLGVAFGGPVPEDSSGFNFKTKFQFGPALGVRFHPSDRFHVRVAARGIFWRLSYPARFFNDPLNAPGTDPLLNQLVENDSQWTFHPTLVFGIGYTLRR
jgi:hypothetical protein